MNRLTESLLLVLAILLVILMFESVFKPKFDGVMEKVTKVEAKRAF